MTAVKTRITVTICEPITRRRKRKVRIDNLKPYLIREEHLKGYKYGIVKDEIVVGGRADSAGKGLDSHDSTY